MDFSFCAESVEIGSGARSFRYSAIVRRRPRQIDNLAYVCEEFAYVANEKIWRFKRGEVPTAIKF